MLNFINFCRLKYIEPCLKGYTISKFSYIMPSQMWINTYSHIIQHVIPVSMWAGEKDNHLYYQQYHLYKHLKITRRLWFHCKYLGWGVQETNKWSALIRLMYAHLYISVYCSYIVGKFSGNATNSFHLYVWELYKLIKGRYSATHQCCLLLFNKGSIRTRHASHSCGNK